MRRRDATALLKINNLLLLTVFYIFIELLRSFFDDVVICVKNVGYVRLDLRKVSGDVSRRSRYSETWSHSNKSPGSSRLGKGDGFIFLKR